MNQEELKESGRRIRTLRKAGGHSQKDVAKATGVDQSAVSAWERGVNSVSGRALTKLANFLRTNEKYLICESKSPSPSSVFYGVVRDVLESEEESDFDMSEAMGVAAWDSSSELGDDFVDIPFFSDLSIAAGTGSSGGEEIKGPKLPFAKSTLKAHNVPPGSAFFIRVRGNSMEPQIPHGSTVGINTSSTKVIDGEVYAVEYKGLFRLKVVIEKSADEYILRSYNSVDHEDNILPKSEVRIIGQRFAVQTVFLTG